MILGQTFHFHISRAFLNSQIVQNFCSEMLCKCESVYLLGPGVGANHTLPSGHKTAGTLDFLHGWVNDTPPTGLPTVGVH